MPINRRADKEDMVNIHSGILLSHKKGWTNAIYITMDEPRDCHTGWNKSDQERQIYDIDYMWNLKQRGINELIYKTETELQM